MYAAESKFVAIEIIDVIKEDLFEVKRMIENSFLTEKQLASYFDHTNLKPFATEQKDIKQIKEYQACLKKLEDTIRLKNKK